MDKKKNILFVCDSLHTLVSGATFSTLRFIDLLKKDYNIISLETKSNKIKKDFEIKNGIKIYYLNSILLPKSHKELYLGFPRKKTIENIIRTEKIDIVYTILPTPLTIKTLKVAKKLNIKTVTASHSQIENLLGNNKNNFFYKFIEKIYSKYLSYIYGKADKIVFPSEFAKQSLKNLNKKSSKKIEVVSNGVDLTKFKLIKNINIKKFDVNSNEKVLLFVGRIFPEKSIETLIKSISDVKKQSNNFKVLIAGSGVLEENLKKLTNKLDLNDKIKFLGRVSDKDLIELYNIADIFVFPSIAELEGMVVLEAMACKTAVITSDSKSNASKFFISNNGFVFKHKNPQDLASKIITLLNDSKLLEDMKNNSYIISKNHSIENSIKLLKENVLN